MTTILYKKIDCLTEFSRRVPNAERMIYDWLNDTLDVYFDGIHCKRYSIKEILTMFEHSAKKQGYSIQWE